MLGQMVGNDVISKVDDFMYIVLSRAENTSLWGISWYHRMCLLRLTVTYTVLIQLKNEYHPDCHTCMWVLNRIIYQDKLQLVLCFSKTAAPHSLLLFPQYEEQY